MQMLESVELFKGRLDIRFEVFKEGFHGWKSNWNFQWHRLRLVCFLIDFFQLHHLAGVRKYIYLLIICLCVNLSTFVLKIFSNRK